MSEGYVQGPIDQSGKAWATEVIEQLSAPDDEAHVQKILIANADGSIQGEYPISIAEAAVQTDTITSVAGNDVNFDVAGYSSALVTLHGTYGSFIIVFAADNGSGQFPAILGQYLGDGLVSAAHTTGTNGNSAYILNVAGFQTLKIVSLTDPASGTCNLRCIPSAAAPPPLVLKLGANLNQDIGLVGLKAGTNNVGDVDIASIAAGNNNIGDVDVASIAAGSNAIGKVNHDTTGGNVDRKVVTTAGTRVDLASSTTAKWVIITAETDNTGIIVAGPGNVIASLATRIGTPLNAGDSVSFLIDNLNDIKLDSTVSGDGVTYSYGT